MVMVKWVRIHTGTTLKPDMRRRLVAQELGYMERLDELLVGTPSLMVVRLILHQAACQQDAMGIMVLDVKCAFLYSSRRWRVYIELPE